MTDRPRGFEEPPELDADDEAILDRIHFERGIREGIAAKIDRRGIPDVPPQSTPPPLRTPPPPRRR